ncbi:MAG: acyl-CoA dehydrogenase family protein [Pacificibacter sp.]|uniref:acyl-CoA dehydrogenase family protein n=1 Tax=Pacificibacter sp. TaxID=1917866 RepID=UPI00321BC3ED
MIPFKSPTADILWSMTHVADAARVDHFDADMTGEILEHFSSFAEGVLAPIDEHGDAQGCQLTDGKVTMPDGYKDAFEQLSEGGWQGLTAPEDFGGMEMDHLTAAAISEVFSGANHALQMVCNLVPGAISTLMRFGTDAQKQAWIPRLASGEVLSTMCLTESGAGSDLSRIRTKATQDGDLWKIDGEKIFISGGDQDMSQGILHLVLARTGGADEGVKGLSLFLCASDVGGAQNAITVTRIEEKLGLHASPTCQMSFDGATAELIGAQGDGLKAMFTMMNHARLDVSLQGVAHATRAHDIASAYAAERKQGRKADRSEAVLNDHADVKRMLETQHSLALGARAMAHITLVEMELGQRPELVEFLTPICKVFCTEAGISSADLGMQVLGGYGYLTEYRVSQTWRDARITSIYEGANGIHAAALATRGLRGGGADAFADLIGELSDAPDVTALLEAWQSARADVLAASDPTELAHDFMALTAEVLFRAAWSRMVRVADQSGDAAVIKTLAKRVARRPMPVALPL